MIGVMPELDWRAGPEALAVLDARWDALAAACPTPFALSAWLRPWYAAFAAHERVRVARVLVDGEPRAGAALLAVPGGLAAPVNDHTPTTELPAAGDADRQALVAGLLARREGAVRLDALDGAGAAARALAAGARGASRRTLTEPRQVSPVVDTSVGVEAVRAETKPTWGAPLDRFRRKLGRDHDARIALLEAPADPGPLLERGFAVESSGWKGEAGTGILSSPATAAFYREMALAFHARGALRLSWIELDGELAAFDLTLEHANRLWLIKTGFDERFRRLAPGLVLRLAVIEACAERGLEAHELLGGEDGWKRKFARSRAPPRGDRCLPRDAGRPGRADLPRRRAPGSRQPASSGSSP